MPPPPCCPICAFGCTGTGHTAPAVDVPIGTLFGCEGDVRVFFDGRQSPEMEGDGSESRASYGWGFVTPPQCNPFSGYNGRYNSNSDWSEVRLTHGDSYFFTESLVFELEHGGANEGIGRHSGQIFADMIPVAAQDTDLIDFTDGNSHDAHGFEHQNAVTEHSIYAAYANGINTQNAFPGKTVSTDGSIRFTLTVSPQNHGITLIRTSSPKSRTSGRPVAVDGVTVTPVDVGSGLTWNMSSLRAVSVLFGTSQAGESDPETQPETDIQTD